MSVTVSSTLSASSFALTVTVLAVVKDRLPKVRVVGSTVRSVPACPVMATVTSVLLLCDRATV